MTAFALRSRRAAADALLARDYEQLKPEIVATVGGKLAAAGVRLDAADLDAAYNQAWHALHTKLAEGEVVDNHRGLLVSIAHRRALDEHRALHPSRRADAEQLDDLSREPDVDARLDDEMRLRQFVGGLRERLDRRELQAAALCYVYEYSRPEAARLIGVAPKRMEKSMDAVSRKIAPMIGEIRAGAWCEEHRSLVKAYALGLLDEDGERHALARDHLADCSSCRRSVLRLRGIAAIAPPVPLALGAVALLGAGAAGAGAGGSGAAGASAGAGAGAAGGSGGGPATTGSGLRHLLSEPRAKIAAAAAVTLAALIALVLSLGGEKSPRQANGAPTTSAAAARRAAAAADARAEAAREARAAAAARSARRARAAAARRRAAAARRRAQAARAAASSAPAAAVPAPTPVQPAPPPAPAPDPAPAPAAQPAPEPPEPPLVRDGAEEFELR